jgi:hypothetical protein
MKQFLVDKSSERLQRQAHVLLLLDAGWALPQEVYLALRAGVRLVKTSAT